MIQIKDCIQGQWYKFYPYRGNGYKESDNCYNYAWYAKYDKNDSFSKYVGKYHDDSGIGSGRNGNFHGSLHDLVPCSYAEVHDLLPKELRERIDIKGLFKTKKHVI